MPTTKIDPKSVPCPKCHVPVGEKCRDRQGRGGPPHRDRIAAAGLSVVPAPEPAPEPPVTRPAGELPLWQIDGIPGHVVNRLALLKPEPVLTLADLRGRAEPSAVNDPVWSALTACGVTGGDRLAAYKAVTAHLNPDPKGAGRAKGHRGEAPPPDHPGEDAGGTGGRAGGGPAGDDAGPGRPDRPVRSEVARTPPADDFTESDPPPRRRPQGLPVGRYVTLPAGESAARSFGAWDHQGRVPAGSVLCRFVGTGLDPKASGYVVAALPMETDPPRLALGPVGTPVREAKLDGYRVLSVVVVKGELGTYAVMSPKEGR